MHLLALLLALLGPPDLDQVAPAAVSVRIDDGRRLLVFGAAVQNGAALSGAALRLSRRRRAQPATA